MHTDMNSLLHRMIRWNEIRCERVPQIELRSNLQIEEAKEVKEALYALDDLFAEDNEFDPDKYAELKAHAAKELFDCIFVAVGTLWQLGFNADQIKSILYLGCTSNDSKPEKKLAIGEKGSKGEKFVPAEPSIANLIKQWEQNNHE